MSTQPATHEELHTETNPLPGELLCQAVSQDDLAEVQRLLAAGVDVNGRSAEDNLSALMLADSAEMADLLLNAGADVHLLDVDDRDALFYALERANEAVIQRLHKAGADLNWGDELGWTRLRIAAFHREPETLALLLNYGADPARNRGKLLSAASCQVRAGDNEATERTIDLLMAAGEDVHATDDYGYTALHSACAALNFTYTPVDEHWWNAASLGPDETATRTLLKYGAAPNATGSNGMTPLLLAVQSAYGAGPCIEALLAADADLEKTGPAGITPLMRAAYRGRDENLRLLLAHGADASRVDRYGHDARYYAEQALACLRSELEKERSAEEPDEEILSWYQEQEENTQLCLALLGGPNLESTKGPFAMLYL